MARDDGPGLDQPKHLHLVKHNPDKKKSGKNKSSSGTDLIKTFVVPPDKPTARPVAAAGDPRLRPAGLTKNEKLLWDVLSAHEGPLKAYEILDLLKEKGVRAPMTVYRALDGLEAKGVIHKLDAMKAYVRCNHDAPHEVQAFLVCEICQAAKEIEIDAVATGISPAVRRAGFDMHTARLEVRGVCDNCFCAKHDHKPGENGHDH